MAQTLPQILARYADTFVAGGGRGCEESLRPGLLVQERSHPQAQLMLGRYLRRGLAGPADPVQAELWFTRAAQNGVREAAAELALINADKAAAAAAAVPPPESNAAAETVKGPQLIHN